MPFVNLKFKLIIASLLVSVLLTATLSFFKLSYDTRQKAAAIEQSLNSIEKHGNDVITSMLWRLDFQGLKLLAKNFLENNKLNFITISDSQGELVVSEGIVPEIAFFEKQFEISKTHNDKIWVLGNVTAGVTRPTLTNAIKTRLNDMLLLNGLLVLIIFSFSYISLYYLVLRNLEKLSHYLANADPYAGSDSLQDILPKKIYPDEIDKLVESIGDMSSKVQKELALRKRVEDELRTSEHHHKIIFQNNPMAIFVMDNEGYVKNCNDKFLYLMGAPREKVIGFNGVKNTSLKMQKTLKKAIAGEQAVYEGEYTSITGGKTIYLYGVYNPITPDSLPSAVIGTYEDISDRVMDAEEKKNMREQLRQSQKMESVGRLAGGVAHDFNNMLSVILGYSESMFHQLDSNHKFHKGLQEIIKATTYSTDLTKQLLAFARKQPVSPQVLNLNTTIEEMLSMLRRLIGEHVTLHFNPTDTPCHIEIDPSQINQILANLCINARDAIINDGYIKIETTLVQDDLSSHLPQPVPPEKHVMLSVTDNGGGMSTEQLEQIFEPFYTTKNKGEGTGLGLATVYGIVKQNDGHINVTSTPNKGSSFDIYFPQQSKNAHNISESHEKRKIEPINQNITILLVEDELAVLKMVDLMLGGEGYHVLKTSKTQEAIDIYNSNKDTIDLLISDVIMPEMNGQELAELLKKTSPELNCLFMSGYTDNLITESIQNDDSLHFIPKPFSRDELLNKIKTITAQHVL